uniref:HAD-IA family hydrolase n=1 Tax=Stappia sp. TaxID=1870903 RepID=UPI003BA8FABF
MPALVFDLDGTLVDTRPDLAAAINTVLRAEGYGEIAMDSLGHLYGHGGRAMLRKAFADQGAAVSDDEIERMNAAFVEAYRADIARLSRPFPGVREALASAADLGWKLAVCTNKREDLALELLETLDLLAPFAAIVGGNTFARAKPDAMPLLGAIERAGGDRLHSVMIGDSQTDIDAARAAGVPVVAVTFGYTAVPVRELGPDAVIDTFDALAAALERIGRAPAGAS